jgi:arylsulfatase A-like enzyme
VVVIMLDDARPDQLVDLPNIEALFESGGTRFVDAVANTPECCPSRASWFSGQFPHNHGVYRSVTPWGWQAFDEDDTLAVWLDEAGYDTAFVGKYLNGFGEQAPPAVPPGWDRWFAGVDPTTYAYYGGARVHTGDGSIVEVPPDEYLSDFYADRLEEILVEQAAGDAPFFLNYAPISPHTGTSQPGGLAWPYPAVRHRDTVERPFPATANYNEDDNSDKPAAIRAMAPLSPAALAAYDDQWESGIETLIAIDETVGRLVDVLDAGGELGNTVFVLTSDNGYAYGEHRLVAKYWPYEEMLRVPLMIAGPGVPVGANRSGPVGMVDLTATVVDLSGATPSLPLDGISLWPALTQPALLTGRAMLTEAGTPGEPNAWQQVRTLFEVLTRYGSGEREYYDLGDDPYQLQNAIDVVERAPAIATLQAELDRLSACQGAACRAGLAGYPSPVRKPAVTAVEPNVDIEAGGRTVTIRGNGLSGTTDVLFGAEPASAFTVRSDTEIEVTVPPQVAGTVRVTVTGPSGTSDAGRFADGFTYLVRPPDAVVLAAAPLEISTTGGVEVTLTGTDLEYVNEVLVAGSPGQVVATDATSVRVRTPAGAAGPVEVVASTPWATAAPVTVTYIDPGPSPTVSALSPNRGPTSGGTSVVVTGTGFDHVTEVRFGSLQATNWTVESPTRLVATAPPNSGPVLVNVRVTTWAGTSPTVAWKTWFAYGSHPVPDVDRISPARGPTAGGTTVTITGRGFLDASEVTFGGVRASAFTVVSDTQITAVAPSFPAGVLVTVRVAGPGGVSVPDGWATSFAYQSPPPVPNIDGRAPSQGPIAGGTVVTITGTGFTGATSVSFGGVASPSVTVQSGTQITAVTPSFPIPYLVAIRVTGPGGTSPTEGWSTTFGYRASRGPAQPSI